MKTTWEHYQSRRQIKLDKWVRQYNISTYDQLDKFCHSRGVETPSLELIEREAGFLLTKPPVSKPTPGLTRTVLPAGTARKSTVQIEEQEEAPEATPRVEEQEKASDETLPRGLMVDKDGYVVPGGEGDSGGES